MPTWWLALSAVFLFVNIVFFGVLTYVAWKLLGLAATVRPEITKLGARLDSIGSKVDDLTSTVKEVAARVGQKAEGVAGSAEHISHVAADQVERFGPAIAAAATVYKVVGALRQILFFRMGARTEAKEFAKRRVRELAGRNR